MTLTDSDTIPLWARDTIGTRWLAYHAAHPEVYDLLASLARQWMNARPGEPCGLKMLMERARWESAVGSRTDAYKIDNRYSALYARALMEWEPDLDGLFVTRQRRSDVVMAPESARPPATPEDAVPAVFDVSQGGELPTVWARLGPRSKTVHLIRQRDRHGEATAACGRLGIDPDLLPFDGERCGTCRWRVGQLVADPE